MGDRAAGEMGVVGCNDCKKWIKMHLQATLEALLEAKDRRDLRSGGSLPRRQKLNSESAVRH